MKIFRFACALSFLGHGASAQLPLRGTVRDSATGQPLAGVVLVISDAGRGARAITGENGRYSLPLATGAQKVQLLRIGFRSRTLDIPPSENERARFDITMARLPTMLEAVRAVSANRCKARPDAAASLALLEQARAALLATVVARDANPATVTRLAFDRGVDVNKSRATSQKVRIETGVRAGASFNATRSVQELAVRGFLRDSAGTQTFFGPDADVLLDDQFVAAYCFNLAAKDAAHPNAVGLAFNAAAPKRGRVDIRGTLWVDTAARALTNIDFRYVGFDNNVMEGLGTGGSISFAHASNGVTLIDRWHLRLIGDADTAVYGPKAGPDIRRGFAVREVGGELARATWPDGATWKGALGTLRIATMERGGGSAAGTIITLDSTSYRAVVDSNGVAEIHDLLPGPYTVAVIDRRLSEIGVALPTPLALRAERDSTIGLRLEVPSAEAYVASVCRMDGTVSGASALIGRVVTQEGRPAAGANWKLSKIVDGAWQTISDGGVTGSSGIYHFCRDLAFGETVRLETWTGTQPADMILRRITDSVTVIRAPLRNAMVARIAAAGRGRILRGTVVDSVTRATIPRAHITLSGTQLTALSDSAGRFVIPSVPAGDYAAEIRTWTLDSLGAVVQSGFSFSDTTTAVTLIVPPLARVAASVCGLRDTRAEGLVVGSVEMRGDTLPVANVRVVADWTAPTERQGKRETGNHWAETVTDDKGDFRLCGVPLNTALTVRAESETGGAHPAEVRVASDGAFARAELTLDRDIQSGAIFRGLVVTDSTLLPIADVEISIPGLSRSVVTNERGAFRFPDIPAGIQDVSVRRLSFSPLNTKLQFFPNTTVDRRISLRKAVTLNAVETIASAVIPSFEENKRMGLGHFLTRDQLEKFEGGQMSAAIAQLPGANAMVTQSGSHAFVMSNRRAGAHLPRCTKDCKGVPTGASGGEQALQELRELGIWCPTRAEQSIGMGCGCYSQVYLDKTLMNPGKPTEPFDINTIPPTTIEAVEMYSSPAETPVMYQRLEGRCGVMVIHSRITS
ncbi:MAG: carboxypeptidase regulatory-like domain-containing protein [Gemmatimonadota bacterium]